jgi:hypothetical protein
VRRLLIIIGLLGAGYFAYNYFWAHNFYQKRIDGRAATAMRSTGNIKFSSISLEGVYGQAYRWGVQAGLEKANQSPPTIDGAQRQLQDLPFIISKDSDAESFGFKLTTRLQLHRDVVAIAVECPLQLEHKASVISESFGVLNLMWSQNPRGLYPDTNYVLHLEPDKVHYSHFLNERVFEVSGVTEGPVKIGVFFDATIPDVRSTLITYKRLTLTDNIAHEAIAKLRQAVENGTLNGETTLWALKDDRFSQSGLFRDPALLKSYLHEHLPGQGVKESLTIQELLTALPPEQTQIHLEFFQSYVPSTGTDYQRIVRRVPTEQVDLLILVGNPLPNGTESLIPAIRSMQVSAPIAYFGYEEPERIKEAFGRTAGDLYCVSTLDPNSTEPAYQEFRDAYTQLSGGQAPNETALLGYETAWLMGQALSQSNSSVPIDIANTLKFAKDEWKGVFGEYHFTSNGLAEGRDLFLLRYVDGSYETMEDPDSGL